MDVAGFEKLFGRAKWPKVPFEVHGFIADVQRVDQEFMLMIELLSPDLESVSPALFFGSRRQVIETFAAEEPERLEGQWRTFELNPKNAGAPSVSILASLADAEGVAHRIESVGATPAKVINAHSMPGGSAASRRDIEVFLGKALDDGPLRLAVLDVGQGASAFLYSSRRVMPSLYLDMGGGCGYNAKTLPAGVVKWCFTKNPGILLSHWHWDHWAGATYGGPTNVAGPRAATWLVPSSPPGPLGKRLVAAITGAGGKVMHWPVGNSPVTVASLMLGEATGTGWNDSGMVLLAELERGRFALAPGDAAYQFLPSAMSKPKLQTLLISHHGGALGATPPVGLPMPDNGPNCHAYCSVGHQNTYGHPTIIGAYIGAGWNVVRGDTRLRGQAAKHYDAETGGLAGGSVLPCCLGLHCSLQLNT